MLALDYKNRPLFVLLSVLFVVCLTCDFLMVPMLAMVPAPLRVPGIPLLLAIVGCVLAQGCLLAAWLAWSDQPFWQRLMRHWIIAAILYLVWTAGLAVCRVSQFAEVASFVGLSVPLVSIAAQTPLWLARQLFGWRLVRVDAKSDSGPAPLSIRGLMTATALVALALAAARLAPSPDGKDLGIVWVIIVVMASTVSSIALLPASALLLRAQVFQCGMLFAGLYAASWVLLLWLVVLVARHGGLFSPPHQAIVVGATFLILSFAATVILAAAAARARGYRLVWGRRPPPNTGF